MLSISQIPDWILRADNGLHGDVEAFMERYETGELATAYDTMCAQAELSDTQVLIWMRGLDYVERSSAV